MLVRVFKLGYGGGINEFNYVGKIKNNQFVIETGKWKFQFWKRLNLDSLPKKEMIDENNRVYYLEVTPSNYLQIKKTIALSAIDKFADVDSDVFTESVAAVNDARLRYQPDNMWKKLLPYAGLILFVVLSIVLYAMLTNATGVGA